MNDEDHQERWDIIIIGAGAAGLMAAFRAASLGRRVVILEKNRKPGVKILISGGTRCNVTHDTDVTGILEAFGEQGRFLRPAIHRLPPADVVRFFHESGVATKIEPHNGKVFPLSDRALDIQQALVRRATEAGAALCLDHTVARLHSDANGWTVETNHGPFFGSQLIVTTGGRSYPGCGTTGDAYAWMEELGHTIVPPRPALVPLTSNATWLTDLTGITLEDVQATVLPTDAIKAWETLPDLAQRAAICRKRQTHSRRGSLLITHFGLSGPAAMDASRAITDQAHADDVRLILDLIPNVDNDSLMSQALQPRPENVARPALPWVQTFVPHRVALMLLQRADTDPQARWGELSKNQRLRVVQQLKTLVIPVSGSRGFTKAEVTAGGVSRRDVDSKSMASRRAPRLYLAGEVLDIDGPIGGYNFQAAFSTGWLAAEHAAATE